MSRAWMQARNMATAVLETRVNFTTLATVAGWMERQGWRPRTKSELIRLAMEVLETQIVDAKLSKQFTDTEEAMDFLSDMGLDGMNRNQRGMRALAQQLQREAAQKEYLGDISARKPQISDMTKPRLVDEDTGMLYFGTMQKLLDLGYECGEMDGSDLPEGVYAKLKEGIFPKAKEA